MGIKAPDNTIPSCEVILVCLAGLLLSLQSCGFHYAAGTMAVFKRALLPEENLTARIVDLADKLFLEP